MTEIFFWGGGNFHDTTPFSFIKTYRFYFRVGVIFTKKTKARKTRKLPPHENFHIYSNNVIGLYISCVLAEKEDTFYIIRPAFLSVLNTASDLMLTCIMEPYSKVKHR